MTVEGAALDIRVVVLDIEGTTTPIEFVSEVLFPYARAHAAAYLARHANAAACRETVAWLREEYAAGAVQDPSAVRPGPFDSMRILSSSKDERVSQDRPVDGRVLGAGPTAIVAYVHWLMDRDRKSRGLKALQGLIWQDGYRSGELRGVVFPDVVPALERWRARGLKICIYSSGSVLAQQLLFRSTNAGDLTKLLSGYFDTAVGPKTSPDSYQAIIDALGVRAPEALFVSDVAAELDAARAAGLQTALCVRNPSASAGHPSHRVVRTFNEILE